MVGIVIRAWKWYAGSWFGSNLWLHPIHQKISLIGMFISSSASNSNQVPNSPVSALATFRHVLQAEAAAIVAGAERLGPEIDAAIELLRQTKGRVIFTGLGKTGYVARKGAATFCSTGTPAIFLHPSEALHGDLGVVTPGDVLIALSNSGETEEVLGLLPFMVRMGVPVLAVTGNIQSSLAIRSTLVLDASVKCEADPISVAPTSSTTLAMAMCDALAVALMSQRGFTRQQFAIFHPGGHLGRKLLLQVGDLMRVGERVPVINAAGNLNEAIEIISAKRMGAVIVISSQRHVVGILTDGDLRRLYQHSTPQTVNVESSPIMTLMTHSPKQIHSTGLAAEALKMMEDNQITVLPVVDAQDQFVGAIHLHDLIRAGLA